MNRVETRSLIVWAGVALAIAAALLIVIGMLILSDSCIVDDMSPLW